MWHVTLKNLWSRKLRLLSTSLAVLLGVAFVSGSMILSSAINSLFDDLFGDTYENIDVVVRGEEPEFGGQRPLVASSLIEEVGNVPGVAKVEGYYEGPAQLVDKFGKAIGGMGPPALGVPWITDSDFNPYQLVEGRAPVGSDEFVADAATAKRGGINIGDRAPVLTPTGVLNLELVGIAKFGELDSAGGSNYLFFSPELAQELVGVPGRVLYVTAVASEGVSASELADRVEARMPGDTEVLTGAEAGEQDSQALKEGLSFLSIIPLVFAGISLFVGAFIINNTFSILVAQRSKEMALMRAIGASRRQVLMSVITEALIVGLIASVAGLFVGIGVAAGLIAFFKLVGLELPASDLPLEASTVVTALVAGAGVTLVAAILPARRASKIAPIAAMRDVAIDRSNTSKTRAVIGILVTALGFGGILLGLFVDIERPYIPVGLGAAVTFIGVYVLGPTFARPVTALLGWPIAKLKGTTGVLARQNAMRNPRRTSSTAAALMIGVTLVTLVSVFTDSAKASVSRFIDRSFTGDLLVLGPPGFGVGLPPALAQAIDALPESERVIGFSSVTALTDAGTSFLTAVDTKSLEGVVSTPMAEGDLADVGRGTFAALDDLAESNDWDIGETVRFDFPQGGSESLRLVATYSDESLLGPAVISPETYEANVARPANSVLIITRSEGVTGDQLRRPVETLAGPYPNASVQDQSEFKETVSGQIDMILNIFLALLALAVVIALLGIANTLALSVFERTRELGLLRAVGMSRRQVRAMVRWESVILALLGALLGLVIGVLFGIALVRALADDGIEVLSIPVLRLAIITLVAALAGVVAALLPARRASRLDILKAISTE